MAYIVLDYILLIRMS